MASLSWQNDTCKCADIASRDPNVDPRNAICVQYFYTRRRVPSAIGNPTNGYRLRFDTRPFPLPEFRCDHDDDACPAVGS
nr:hypothetical protein CFP56_00514 [Quercus suber]